MFEPDRHLRPEAPASDAVLEGGIADIVEGLLDSRLTDGWPVRPNDLNGEPVPERPHQSLYMGAAGTVWALGALRDRCAIPLDLDALAHGIAREYPGDGDPDAPSWFLGHAGVEAIALSFRWDDRLVGSLLERIRGNATNPTWETLWGSPGTMLAARMVGRCAADPDPWQAAWEDSARALLDAREPDGLWTQDLYGRVRQLTGAGHGYVGNLQALFAGGDWLAADMQKELTEQAVDVLTRLAIWDPAHTMCNWEPEVTPVEGRPRKMLMQWCHGSPGVITSLRSAPAHEGLDALLCAAGEAVWAAGPLSKGASLCHGTAGNGWAFLVLYERTGDPVWLERARSFATTALAQVAEQRATTGIRASLFTGDPGVALFADAILRRDGAFPLLDV